MERQEKLKAVEALAKKLEGKDVLLLSDFTGMNVEVATELRARFREASVDFTVVKNTLARRAFEAAGFPELAEQLTGPNAIALSVGDPVAPAKILVEFEKKRKTPTITRGWIESASVSAVEIRRIAELPSREVLLSQIMAGFQAPVSGFARLMSEMMRKLVATLDEVAKQKGAAEV